jgi:hypothetical protein
VANYEMLTVDRADELRWPRLVDRNLDEKLNTRPSTAPSGLSSGRIILMDDGRDAKRSHITPESSNVIPN